MSVLLDRRRFERFSVPPMYTAVRVRRLDGGSWVEGHARDVSEAGVRFDLDHPIELGAMVEIEVALPGVVPAETVRAVGRIVWVRADADEPGPVPMAAVVTRFARIQDRERLLIALGSGRFARAA